MTAFDKLELGFIIIEFIAILIEIGLQLYEIKTSKDMEKKIMYRFDKLKDNTNVLKNNKKVL